MTQKKPNLNYESQYTGRIAGVDEAGRGPLAGPVVAAAVILDINNIPQGLNDSKKLSERRREALYVDITARAHYSIGIAEPEEIDRINVLAATMAAMGRAVLGLSIRPDAVLVDGNRAPDFGIPARTVIKGDSESLSIAAASIIAKVTRDRLMQQAERRFPGYGLAQHKGYPTKIHKDALTKIGVSPIHRRSYAPVRDALTLLNKK